MELNYGNNGNLHIKDGEEKLYINEIQISKNPYSEKSTSKKLYYKNNEHFYLPINNKFVSFLASNGTGKTLLSKTISHFFLNYDNNISAQINQPEFAENDNFSIINKYIISSVVFKNTNLTQNIYLFSLNNIYEHKYDYLILPHLEYVLQKFNLVRVFNEYIDNNDYISYIEQFYLAIEKEIPNGMAYEQQFRVLFKETIIFDETKSKNILTLLIYLVEKLAIENNISLRDLLEKIMLDDNSISWKPIEKFIGNTMFTKNKDMTIVKQMFNSLLSFSTKYEQKNLMIKDLIVESVNDFKLNNEFYKLFKDDFNKFELFINNNLNKSIIEIDESKSIKLIEHYFDLFETKIYYPITIFENDKSLHIDDFSDEYDRFDKNSVRSIFSLIEKNGSEYEKINYKNKCSLIFLKFLKSNLSENNNKIIILSDDIFSQTDNHNILNNLLEFNNALENYNLINVTSWLNLTHSFSAFQIFNKSLNVDYNNMNIIKKYDNSLIVEPFTIKNKFFLDYLDKQINSANLEDEEKTISIFTKIIYDRFLFESLPEQKNKENILTHFLHYFPKDLNKFKIENDTDIPQYVQELISLVEKESNSTGITYDKLFSLMERTFNKSYSDYKKIKDIEICFFYSIYLRFLIEKTIYEYLNPSQINADLNYTGELIKLLKNQNLEIYKKIINLYNLSKNYIHHDYINYEYIIFVNPIDYKNNILNLKKLLLTLK